MAVQNRFAELLAAKARRTGRTITHEEVAEATGLSTNTISKWANNRVNRFDANTIDALCRYLNCTLNELLVRPAEDGDDPKVGQELARLRISA